MGKPKKNLFEQKTKKSKSKRQISKMNSDDDDQVDDIMAWGRKKQNYYKQDEDEYSSLSEQQHEAEQIYKSKYDNYMNDEDVYDIPNEKDIRVDNHKALEPEFQDQDQEGLPQEYVRQQLEWVLEIFKDLQFYQDNSLLKIYEKLLKSYLTVMISIKQLKIPYIQYHPIIPMAVQIKTKIAKLMKKLTVKEEIESDDQADKQKNHKNKGQKSFNKQESFNSQDQDDQEEIDFDQDDENLFDENEKIEESYLDESEQHMPKKAKKLSKKTFPDHCSQASKSQKQEHTKGIEFYNKMKAANELQKKQKKQEKRQQRKQNKKPAFKQLGQNQGRFASELILKNKGLMKKRKKIEGNSRVKLRMKYQKKKAIHRARSGHFIKENPGRSYQGESNIRTGKIAGVKLK